MCLFLGGFFYVSYFGTRLIFGEEERAEDKISGRREEGVFSFKGFWVFRRFMLSILSGDSVRGERRWEF